MKKEVSEIDFLNIPVNSSLGHLAYGHIAFLAWRNIKLENSLITKNQKNNE